MGILRPRNPSLRELGGGWWLHLRRCARCGHIGCCDNSPARHATAHARSTGQPIIKSFEPGEDWFWNYRSSVFFHGPDAPGASSDRADGPGPGLAGTC
jgi:hypothetical protein